MITFSVRITIVVADWLGWNPYHRSSFFTVSDWIILKFKLFYRWNFLSALLKRRYRKLIRRYFQRRAFVASKYSYYEIDVIKICTNVYLMVLVQNKYKNTLVGVLRTQITFVTHSSPSCYVTLRTQVIRLNSGNLGPQKTTWVFLLLYYMVLHLSAKAKNNMHINGKGWILQQSAAMLIADGPT